MEEDNYDKNQKKSRYAYQCFIQALFFGGGKFPTPNIETSPPQEFSATPAVKLK